MHVTIWQPANGSPAASPEAYMGTNPFVGQVQVAADNGGLVLTLGPDQTGYRMTHYDRDVFTSQPIGEGAFGPSGVTFAAGADGKASDVVIEALDLYGAGTLGRVEPGS